MSGETTFPEESRTCQEKTWPPVASRGGVETAGCGGWVASGGPETSHVGRVAEAEKGALSVGSPFRRPVREEKVSEVRRRETGKAEGTERNSLRERKGCQTGTRLGNTPRCSVNYCLLRGSEATVQISTCGPATHGLDGSSGASASGLGPGGLDRISSRYL